VLDSTEQTLYFDNDFGHTALATVPGELGIGADTGVTTIG